MMNGNSKQAVLERIYQATLTGNFHAKVENDPYLSPQESKTLVNAFWQNKHSWQGHYRNLLARWFANQASAWLNRQTEYVGLNNLRAIHSGAIITSNHFNPLENTAVR